MGNKRSALAVSSRLGRLIRSSWEELLSEAPPEDPRWEGVLYAEQTLRSAPGDDEVRCSAPFPSTSSLAATRVFLEHRALAKEGLALLVSGEPLCSEAFTPFVLDDVEYPSVRVFYESLKYREGRAAFVAEETNMAEAWAAWRANPSSPAPPIRKKPRWQESATFHHDGAEHEVGGLGHLVLVARATQAKVQSHAWVREALAVTQEARLHMGTGAQALSRVMPFALMVMRSGERRR